MEYMYIKETDEMFVLFHGTGGNENSLLFLTGELNPYASVLSFSGDTGVGIKRRFFAPLIGKREPDRKDLAERVDKFLTQWDNLELIKGKKITFIGYSNGANFITAILEKRPDIADKTILLHPSHLGWKFESRPLKNVIIVTTGATDLMAPAGDVMKMKKEFENIGYDKFDVILLDGGHEINDQEIEKLKKYYKNKF